MESLTGRAYEYKFLLFYISPSTTTIIYNNQHQQQLKNRISAEKICNHKLEKKTSVRDFMEVRERGKRKEVREIQDSFVFIFVRSIFRQ